MALKYSSCVAKNRTFHICVAVSIMFLLLGLLGFSTQTEDDSKITLEQIFTTRDFTTASPGNFRWFDDEQGSVNLEKSTIDEEFKDIVCQHPETGKRTIIVSAARLIPEGKEKPLQIIDFAFSEDKKKVLLTASHEVKVENSQQEHWIYELSNQKLYRTIDKDYSNDVISVELSPDGDKVAYIYNNDIYVEWLTTRASIRLTEDGSQLLINGNSKDRFAAVANTGGYRWSPDSRRIAFMQIDTEGVKYFSMINNTDSLYPKIISFQHVKPGEKLPASRVGIVQASGGKTVWCKIPGDPRNHYITHITWANRSDELMVQQLNRHQNTTKIFRADANSGQAENLFIDSDEAFLTRERAHWSGDGRYFLWLSEKDGWRHIYKVSRGGQQSELLTPGDLDVDSIAGVDEQRGWIYFIASPDNAIFRFLFRVSLDGNGTIERITPEGKDGTHSYQIFPSSRFAVHSFSNFETPPVTEFINLPGHEVLKVIEDNAVLREKLKNQSLTPSEFLKVGIGEGVELDAWCLKPPDFDPDKKYPVVFHVYSMPASQVVVDRWKGDSYMFYQLLAQKGFIVMGIDSRGTPSLYGRAWRKIIYKKHGILPADDIAAAVKALTKQRPYMDASRVGVYGWSGGGLVSLLLILRHPDVFQTAVPGAYISHHRFYSAGFTERFLGLPQENPEAYEETAALNYAENLEGNLLLLHGTGDDNVHYQSTEALIDKLIAAKKRFYVMPYPNRSHGMREGRNTRYHQYDMALWFFSQHMLNPFE